MSMIPRTLFAPEHEEFRKTLRRFFAEEIMPHHDHWEEQGFIDRKIWTRAGELGFLCMAIPEEYGGGGAGRLYSIVMMEETAQARASAITFSVHSDVIANYIFNFGTEEQKQTWLPKMSTGEVIGAVAMTEPAGGSDLKALKTRAVADGDDYVISGSKIFISNGYTADIFVVAVRTASTGDGKGDISLILVERDRAGFKKGQPLKKVGMRGQDTCELFFEDVRVPQSSVLGGIPGKGFVMLMKELAWERLMAAIGSVTSAQVALDMTLEYTRNRKAFGKPIADFQNSRFKLAEMKSEISIARVFVDRCIELQLKKELTPDTAAMAKYWTTDLYCKVVDQCVQLHGGYGFMMEYPIAHAFIDSRASRIYLGTNEIMKEVISRAM
jgi:alkylation response protein AidB-like acyl-CoA dehydrogenase